MNLITEYFTYTHLVNVIQQTESKGRYAGFSASLSFMLQSLCCHWALGVPVWAVSSAGKRTTPPPPSSPHPPKKNPQSKTLIAACSERKSHPVCEQTAWRNPCSSQTLAFPLLTADVVCVFLLHTAAFLPLLVLGEEKGAGPGGVWENKSHCSELGERQVKVSSSHLGHTSSARLLPRKPFSATPTFIFPLLTMPPAL